MIAVVVVSAGAAWFGFTHDDAERPLRLSNARKAELWQHRAGVVGLAKHGPMRGSRISEPVDVVLHDVTAVLATTKRSVTQWQSFTPDL